jgi:hypothetical protein
MKAGAVRALQKPSERMYMMIRRFHHNNRPLMDAETDAIRCKDDIITLRSGRELATFDTWVESGIERTLLKPLMNKSCIVRHVPGMSSLSPPDNKLTLPQCRTAAGVLHISMILSSAHYAPGLYFMYITQIPSSLPRPKISSYCINSTLSYF